MSNIIWTKEELKKIRKIILTSANLKLTEDAELIELPTSYYNTRSTSSYAKEANELKKLFYCTNKEQIIDILTKASEIKAEPNNKLHYGFITTLSKINPENPEEIFIIFREIISQYDKSISGISLKIIEKLDNIDEVKNRIREISHSTEITAEEELIKREIEKVFSFANGVPSDKLFASLIEDLDSQIKPKLLTRMKRTINSTANAQNNNRIQECQSCSMEYKRKFQRKHLDKLKRKGEKIFPY